MKDKLRELAERWKNYCSDDVGRELAKEECATELLAILDAEGDGGVVDSNALSEVIADMRGRERVGVEKYGVTVDRKDLTQAEWGKHLSEELMDALLYLKRLQDCTCPSGDGSLRWPCPVHPARSGVVSDATPEMCDSVRYLLVGMERPGRTFGTVREHCRFAGMDVENWPDWTLNRDTEHFNKSACAALIWWLMHRAAIQGERHER